MGLLIHCGLQDFFREAVHRDISDKSLLMLGRQVISHTRAELYVFARRFGVPLDYAGMTDNPKSGGADSVSFFRALGFREVRALDISSYEGADILFDLNQPTLPESLREKFDYILDGGTTEHVFDYAQALRNIAGMMRPGGRVFHYIPASGQVNHGYYTLSPSLLGDFYAANGFRVERLDIILKKDSYTSPVQSMTDCLTTEPDYRFFNFRDTEGLPGYVGTLRCIATKENTPAAPENPKQTHWYGADESLLREMWAVDCGLAGPEAAIGIWGTGPDATKFLQILSKHPDFAREKVKAFFTYDDHAGAPANLAGYPVLRGRDIVARGVRVLFLTAMDPQLPGALRPLTAAGVKILRLNDYWMALQR